MKRPLALLTALLALLASCAPAPKPAEDRLRVLSWNVWHAGHSREFGDRACREVQGILRAAEADVVLMVETYGAADATADALGFYHRSLSSNLSIYSRYPIRRTFTWPDSIPTFNFGGVEIDLDGQPVRLFATWLHYLPDARLAPADAGRIDAWERSGSRPDEAARILALLRPMLDEADSIPVIMGGDFNIHSHLDRPGEPWPVSQMMAAAGLRDSYREIHPDPATAPGITWLYEVAQAEGEPELPTRRDRIDFIYGAGDALQTVDSECGNAPLDSLFRFRGEAFRYPSDHGFVLTTYRIRRCTPEP